MADDWIEITKEAIMIPAILPKIYDDLASPGVKQVGIALEAIIGLGNTALWPVVIANEYGRLTLKKNLDKLRRSMKDIPQEEVIKVPPELGVPIAEKLGYVDDDVLSDLYIQLLSNAAQRDECSNAHPSFISIINSLSPDEARFISLFRGQVSLEYTFSNQVENGTGGTNIMGEPVVFFESINVLSRPENASIYFENLSALGLFIDDRSLRKKYNLSKPNKASAEFIRQALEKQADEYWTRFVNSDFGIKFEFGVIEITDFGKRFFKACQPKKLTKVSS